jgi:hypothetical protein
MNLVPRPDTGDGVTKRFIALHSKPGRGTRFISILA